MLVDINLLPKKEKRNPLQLILLSSIFAVLIVLAVLTWYVYSAQILERDQLKEQLHNTQSVRGKLEQQTVSQEDGSSVEKLTEAIQWAEDYPFPVSALMKDLTALLPERGYILSFQMQGESSIELSVQFDSSRESAFFLKRLKSSEIISKAAINRIDTREIEEDGDEIESTSIPRYIAQYVITINRDNLIKAHKEENPS
ncbi:type IV pilus assembly protein PilN [Peribacillus deserti]|uniref:Type IV pilus assembly protein PilN n=1 Tax=Peribacillus deserti TaxID=673318 RepID=A0ABS2QFL2_9BACI|nr:hypothetical protein [Peribacillus deserti]MBM7691927.1 type IV pilus assembly protein PilN [Peribacillus deserti]